MSQTRIICEHCGFVQIHCTCKAMTPDPQLARSTAEKIYPIAGQCYEALGLQLCDRKTRNECREETMQELTDLILASYHERDRAATAMGGEMDWPKEAEKLADEICTNVPDLADEMILEFAQRYAQRALTALQESNREVVAERDNIKAAHEEGVEINSELRARLALADEMSQHLLLVLAPESHRMGPEYVAARDCLHRWTAPQAAPVERQDHALQAIENALEQSRTPSRTVPADQLAAHFPEDFAPRSQAMPITPETVVPFPCWLWRISNANGDGIKRDYWWHAKVQFDVAAAMSRGETAATHYHPDQLTAPTCRPTATEGGV